MAVQNCESSIASALTEGLTIHTLAMTAMMVSGLKLTKAEKGTDADTDFLLKANSRAWADDLALFIGGLALGVGLSTYW